MTGPFARVLVLATLVLLSLASSGAGASAQSDPNAQISQLRGKIDHVIVIYEENWSFDSLYGQFPGANGANNRGTPQLQCPVGGTAYAPMTGLPPALIVPGRPTGPWPCGWQGLAGGAQDMNIPMGMAMKPYQLTSFKPPTALTGDLWHIFWHEQLQIDNGYLEPSAGTPLDKFSAYSSNPGLAFSYYNATHMPEGVIASHYVLADNFFHSAFGGSYLNHMWLVCACTPQWSQPVPKSSSTFVSSWNPATKTLLDSNVTTMPRPGIEGGTLYDVNTTFTANSPHPLAVASDQLLQPIPPATKTIGDLLTDASPAIPWKWYAGDWDLALKNSPQAINCAAPSVADPNPAPTGDCFQFHHQPFAYFQRWGTDGSPAKAEHLQDETKFFTDLQNGTLPNVAFIKPAGLDNEHPSYATLLRGQQHMQKIVQAVCDSKYWATTAIVVTYDENGGRWDHVNPPQIDVWGPGTRVPAVIISPYAKAHTVDHTQYETTSILALIEKRFNLPALGSRDMHANPLLNAFDFKQQPLACQAS